MALSACQQVLSTRRRSFPAAAWHPVTGLSTATTFLARTNTNYEIQAMKYKL